MPTTSGQSPRTPYEAHIDQFDAGQGQRCRERGDGDAGFGRGKDDERAPHAIRHAPGEGAAEREAGHEGGQHGAARHGW